MTKQQAALSIASLAVQTLQVVNSMGEKGSSAERARAKALLALQQSIAIGWAWVNAMKAGPWGAALAAAETALIVANFASQSRAIDKSASRESQDISGLSINATAPGIDLGVASPLPSSTSGTGVSFVGGSGGGGGGGGGGGAIINVGGIVVNFSADTLSVDNVDAVMKKMYEKLRQGTIEGVQLAIQMKSVSDKNSNLAA